MNIADLTRRLENLLRAGTIAELDLDPPRCRVKSGGLLTGWLPWFARRAGSTQDWDPPSVGEQCLVFSPSGDPALGFVLVGLYSDAHPAPSASASLCRRTYPDGAEIDYDHASHTLRASLPAGGRVELQAPGGVSIVGDLVITGTLTVSEDVVAGPQAISLVHHKHPGVLPGEGMTGEPTP